MDWSVFPIFLMACAAAASTGAMFAPDQWYRDLPKPRWTPPDWVFPLAWSLVYLVSAIAAARVATTQPNAHAMGFWAVQIALNTLWSPVFFGQHRIRAGLVIITLLWVTLVATIVTFLALPRSKISITSRG
jgi:benzodiazapine receptor